MNGEHVIDLLPDLVLGSLDDAGETVVRRHLRGCGPCRREHAALEAGLEVFGRATHTGEPPPALREQVLTTLDTEWQEVPRARRPRWLPLAGAAAGLALLAGALTWGLTAGRRAARLEARVATLAEDAGEYRAFLSALGGESVEVASLRSPSTASVEGSAIVYHGDQGESWVLVYVDGIVASEPPRALLLGPGEPLELGGVHVDDEGGMSAWLLTSEDLRAYDTLVIADARGAVLARGPIGEPNESRGDARP
jgi:hypothetical protein